MPFSSRDDFLLRVIRQMMEVIARAVGLKREGLYDEALLELDTASGDLLGPLAAAVPLVDPATAAQMIGHPERVLAYARLLAERGDVRRLQGHDGYAEIDEARALALVLEAAERDPSLAPRAADLALGLLSHGAAARLEPAHAAMLRQWDPRAGDGEPAEAPS